MRPAQPDAAAQSDMFRETLEAILDPRHELLELGRRIDWARLDLACGETFVDRVGRPGLPTRLMAGLHVLKHVKGLSDEAVCAAWVENPYFQAFCGERFFQHRLPLDRSSMTRWRQRIGAERLETLLADTLAIACDSGAVKPQAMERVTIDTTIQSKAIAYPTDGHLMLRAVERLAGLARRQGVVLRQADRRLMTLRTQDEHQALTWARRRQQTSDFAAIYAWRAGVEATMSWAVRSFGLRRARYVGLAKVRLQHIATAAALNLIRLTRWSMGAPIASTRASPFARLLRLPV